MMHMHRAACFCQPCWKGARQQISRSPVWQQQAFVSLCRSERLTVSQLRQTCDQRVPSRSQSSLREAEPSSAHVSLGERRQSGSSASTSQSSAPHTPVLLEEVLAAFQNLHLKVFVDGTLGAGGHSAAIAAVHPELETLIGIDMDPTAHAIAQQRLGGLGSGAGDRLDVRQIQGNFGCLKDVLQAELGRSAAGSADGILLDLGMSSMQVDTAGRGFSYQQDGPLDMRMGPQASRSAEEIVNTWPQSALETVLREFGELSSARKLAAKLVEAREQAPIRTTRQLVSALSLNFGPGSVSTTKTLVFQALRIAANDELDVLATALPDAIEALAPGGRLAVISFHSLEDRAVKWAFLRAAGRPTPADEVHLPRWRLAEQPERASSARAACARIVTRTPLRAGAAEAAANPRARSAKLRVLEKLPVEE